MNARKNSGVAVAVLSLIAVALFFVDVPYANIIGLALLAVALIILVRTAM